MNPISLSSPSWPAFAAPPEPRVAVPADPAVEDGVSLGPAAPERPDAQGLARKGGWPPSAPPWPVRWAPWPWPCGSP